MPVVPSGRTEWLALLTQPAAILVGVGLLINQRNKRIDDLREDVKELRKDVKDLQAGQSSLRGLSALPPLPSLPPEVGQWLAPSVVLTVLGLILGLQGKRIDKLLTKAVQGCKSVFQDGVGLSVVLSATFEEAAGQLSWRVDPAASRQQGNARVRTH